MTVVLETGVVSRLSFQMANRDKFVDHLRGIWIGRIGRNNQFVSDCSYVGLSLNRISPALREHYLTCHRASVICPEGDL